MLDVVIMAGGKGLRLGGVKKQFLRICGKRLIDVALEVAREINSERILICLTKEDLVFIGEVKDSKVEVVLCPGQGYVEDLNYILRLSRFPVLVLPADMPLLTSDVLREFLDVAQGELADVITLMVCRDNECRESGISLFKGLGGSWVNVYFKERPELKDIDTMEDIMWVKSICDSTEEIERLK